MNGWFYCSTVEERIEQKNPEYFLENYLPLAEQASVFPGGAKKIISDSRYLFLYDRDDKEPQQLFAKFAQDFSFIAEDSWVTETPRIMEGFDNAAQSKNRFVYLWCHKNDTEDWVSATLEDLVLPLFQQAQENLSQKAEQFINKTFNWLPFETTKKSRITWEAKRKKAVIAALGQGKKPGSSMNVVIEQSGFIQEKHLQACRHVHTFVRCLHQIMAPGQVLD